MDSLKQPFRLCNKYTYSNFYWHALADLFTDPFADPFADFFADPFADFFSDSFADPFTESFPNPLSEPYRNRNTFRNGKPDGLNYAFCHTYPIRNI